jgi:outer membrane murein-binding lipoprotein Lpp
VYLQKNNYLYAKIKNTFMEDIDNNNYSPEPKNGMKVATIILSIAVVILAGILLYVYTAKIPEQKTEISALTTEKEHLMYEMQNLRAQYEDLKTDNDTLNAQLDMERQKVNLMIDKLKKTEASNRSEIQRYKKELGTLRDVMQGYIRQIDSLNTLNNRLRVETSMAKAEARESNEKYQRLTEQAGNMAQQIEKVSVVKARDINLVAINEKGKDVVKASNTDKLRTCLTLSENSIAERGPRSVFIRVKGPDGILMTPSENNVFRVEEGQLIYSAVREIDYQGEDIEVCIFYGSNNEQFAKGTYSVDVFSGGVLIGNGQLLLK